jgi:hypothetical protein
MNTSVLLHRLSFAVALCLPAVSLVALAAEPTETTEVEVIANGRTEKVELVDLKAGETRQVYSEAGTLVTATRTAQSLELDIGGDKTSIRMVEPDAIDDAELAALVEAHHGAGGADGKRIVRIHRDAKHGSDAHVDAHRKVIVIADGEGDVEALDADGLDLLLEQDAGGDGKRVIVRHTRVKSDADAK